MVHFYLCVSVGLINIYSTPITLMHLSRGSCRYDAIHNFTSRTYPSYKAKSLSLLSICHLLSHLKTCSHAKPTISTADCCSNYVLEPSFSSTSNDDFFNRSNKLSPASSSLFRRWEQPRKACVFQTEYSSNYVDMQKNSKQSTASFCVIAYSDSEEERIQTEKVNTKVKERDVGAAKCEFEDLTIEKNVHHSLDTLIDTKARIPGSKRAAEKGNFRSSFDESLTDIEKVYKVIMKFHNNIDMLEMALDKCGVSVTPELVVQVLNKCGDAGNPAFRFFVWAGKQPGYIHKYEACNVMINIMGRMTQFETIWVMLEEMRKTNPSLITAETFIIMMRKFVAASMVQKAIDVLDEMPKFGCEPDAHTFGALLDALCKHDKVQEAIELFVDMKTRFPRNLKNYTVLLNGLCKTGSLDMAHCMLDEMAVLGFEPDLVVYNTLVNGYAKAGKIHKAFDLLNEMKSRGCAPDAVSYTNLIHALCAAERLEEALRLFKDMKKNGCFPDVVTYSILIDSFCKSGKLDQGYQLLEDMIQQRCAPNQITYYRLLREHERRKELKEVLELFQKMSENGCDPDLRNYIPLLRLSCRLGKLNEATIIWNNMESNGISANLDAYTIFIRGLHNQGNLTDACKYFKEMVGKGLLPAPLYGTLKDLLNTLLRAGKLEAAADIWDCMKKSGSHTNIFAYTIWIEGLCSVGEVEEACNYCANMIEDGLLPQPGTYKMIMEGLSNLFNRRTADELRARLRQLISEKNLSKTGCESYARQHVRTEKNLSKTGCESYARQRVRKATRKRISRKSGGRRMRNE